MLQYHWIMYIYISIYIQYGILLYYHTIGMYIYINLYTHTPCPNLHSSSPRRDTAHGRSGRSNTAAGLCPRARDLPSMRQGRLGMWPEDSPTNGVPNLVMTKWFIHGQYTDNLWIIYGQSMDMVDIPSGND